ncbi:hypothetical protein BuS5_02332 [Desulfosarcina sp. BuS5]|uniref:ATP-binding response regulator n=1 Tax=Desulfosarcina sp. BuS5 TaxID=933262 RepID=UPI000687B088|nr:response regulator [Desulfosarcina sp. BuS5]WDN89364.1 hypothetical protein BuS5_02332 [Desulfosarcina sp. BuS5]
MPRILVVDDEENIRFSFKHFLTAAGYEVVTVTHPIDARAILSANEFDVAIIDRILSDGQNGIDLVKYIRAVQPFCEPVLMSGYPSFSSAAETLQFETFAYLAKPVKQEKLCRVVAEAVHKSKAKKNSGHFKSVLQSIFHSSPNAIAICDLSGRARFVNPSFTRIFGYDKKEVIGKHIDYIPAWDQQKTESEIADLRMEKFVPERETQRLTKNGQLIDVTINQSVCRDSQGKATDILFIIRDVTDKREIEKQFQHAQKMEAIGILAGGIAHDFNNILMLMLGRAELALMDMPEDSPARKNLETILKAGKRARDLTRQILAFSRKAGHAKKPVQISLIIKESLKLLEAGLPDSIEIKQNISTNCGTILADPTLIHQLIMNLCTNAYHSMREKGGVIEINMQDVDFESRDSRIDLAPGPYLQLTVSDTGHGMDKDTMDHIFEPYFTTKAVGEGTGLGLSVVHGVIKSHGGAITVTSEVGKGSTFQVYFPKIKNVLTKKTKTVEAVCGDKENILFVDDEAEIVLVMQQMLEHLGYTVTARTNGMEALEAFQAHPDKYDLLITDQSMPGMTGLRLAEEVTRIRADIPIIHLTGVCEQTTAGDATKKIISESISKPVNMEELGKAIRRALKPGRRSTNNESKQQGGEKQWIN